MELKDIQLECDLERNCDLMISVTCHISSNKSGVDFTILGRRNFLAVEGTFQTPLYSILPPYPYFENFAEWVDNFSWRLNLMEVKPVASEPRGHRTPHFLEHGVQRGPGHRNSYNWIGGSYSILAEIIFPAFLGHCGVHDQKLH